MKRRPDDLPPAAQTPPFPPPPRRVGSRDVARAAGVSQSTVSAVLGHRGRHNIVVGEATRLHVKAVAERLGYVPSRLASGFFRGRSHMVGVAILSVVHPPWATWFAGFQRGIAPADYVPLVLTTAWNRARDAGTAPEASGASPAEANLRRLLAQQVDGIVLYSLDSRFAGLDELLRRRIPTVLLGDGRRNPPADIVGSSEAACGRMAARHLLSLGRSSFGLATYPADYPPARRRGAAFVRALASAGHPCPAFAVDEERPEALAPRLRGLLRPPAAVFAMNDHMGIAVMAAAERLGWRVPEDLAVMGMGDFEAGRHCAPKLTTVDRHPFDIGLKAAHMLLERIQGHGGRPRRVTGKITLLARDSTRIAAAT